MKQPQPAGVVQLTPDGWQVVHRDGRKEVFGTQQRAVHALALEGFTEVVLIGIDGEELGRVAGALSEEERQAHAVLRPPTEELGKLRARFVTALYELSGGRETKFVDIDEIVSASGLMRYTADVTGGIVEYLEGEGLLRVVGGGVDHGIVALTHRGRVEVEQRAMRPGKRTPHLPPATSVVNVWGMYGGQIQAATIGSTQVHVTASGPLADWFRELVAALDELPLNEDYRARIRDAAEVVDEELRRPDPRPLVIDRMRVLARDVLVSAMGSGLADEFLRRLNEIV